MSERAKEITQTGGKTLYGAPCLCSCCGPYLGLLKMNQNTTGCLWLVYCLRGGGNPQLCSSDFYLRQLLKSPLYSPRENNILAK